MNRINRRVAKINIASQVVIGNAYDIKKTTCSHRDINYLSSFRGITKQEVDSHIQPLLDALETKDSDTEQTTRRHRAVYPTNATAERRATRTQATSSSRGGRSVARGFQVRSARFFVASERVWSMSSLAKSKTVLLFSYLISYF